MTINLICLCIFVILLDVLFLKDVVDVPLNQLEKLHKYSVCKLKY